MITTPASSSSTERRTQHWLGVICLTAIAATLTAGMLRLSDAVIGGFVLLATNAATSLMTRRSALRNTDDQAGGAGDVDLYRMPPDPGGHP